MAIVITPSDVQELRRMVTNYNGTDKELFNRVVKGITFLQNENNRLRAELGNYKQQDKKNH